MTDGESLSLSGWERWFVGPDRRGDGDGRAGAGWCGWGPWGGPGRERVQICHKDGPRRDRPRTKAQNINDSPPVLRLDPGLCNRFGQPAPPRAPGRTAAGWAATTAAIPTTGRDPPGGAGGRSRARRVYRCGAAAPRFAHGPEPEEGAHDRPEHDPAPEPARAHGGGSGRPGPRRAVPLRDRRPRTGPRDHGPAHHALPRRARPPARGARRGHQRRRSRPARHPLGQEVQRHHLRPARGRELPAPVHARGRRSAAERARTTARAGCAPAARVRPSPLRADHGPHGTTLRP